MSSFFTRPSSDVVTTGWFRNPSSGFYWDKCSDGFPGFDDATYCSVDVSGGAIVFGGSSLPGDFPTGGADSIDYSIRVDLNSTKQSPAPGFIIRVLESDGVTVIAEMAERAMTSASFVTLTGTLSITGTNTATSWTGHKLSITPYENDTSSTVFAYVADLELSVTYTPGGGGGGGGTGTGFGADADPMLGGYDYRATRFSSGRLLGNGIYPDQPGTELTPAEARQILGVHLDPSSQIAATPTSDVVITGPSTAETNVISDTTGEAIGAKTSPDVADGSGWRIMAGGDVDPGGTSITYTWKLTIGGVGVFSLQSNNFGGVSPLNNRGWTLDCFVVANNATASSTVRYGVLLTHTDAADVTQRVLKCGSVGAIDFTTTPTIELSAKTTSIASGARLRCAVCTFERMDVAA